MVTRTSSCPDFTSVTGVDQRNSTPARWQAAPDLAPLREGASLANLPEEERTAWRQFWAEVHLIPLWEVDDVMVYRKNVRGVPDRPVEPYQRVERWKSGLTITRNWAA